MRFRHDILIERSMCAVDAFALVADLSRLPERLPGVPVRVLTNRDGAAGHVVEVGEGDKAMQVTVTALGPGMSVAFAYANGIRQQWRVTDHGQAGCMVTVIVEVDSLVPGEEAEEYRGGLLHDLASIKHVIETQT